MNDAHLMETMQRVRLEFLRTRSLMILEETYPLPQHSDVLFLRLTRELGMECGLNELVKEIHYLAEKGLIRMEQVFADRFMCTISAKGRDFVYGHSGEIDGLASPASFQ